MRVELPDNGWAEIKEVSELRNADRKAVYKNLEFRVDEETQMPVISMASDEQMTEALLRRTITNWSLVLPLPRDDVASIGELTLEQADALGEAVKPHLAVILGKVKPTKKGTDPTTASSS